MRIRIQSAALRFALPHVSTEESRPILNGVLVEPSGVIVAANWHSLLAYKHAAEGAAAPVIVQFRKASDVTARKVAYVELDIPDNSERRNVTATTYARYGVQIGATLVDIVDGPFPNWRQVFPVEHQPVIDIPHIGLSPAVATRFSKSSDQPYSLTFYGAERGAVVQWASTPDAVGIFMPVRLMDPPAFAAWVRDSADWPSLPHPEADASPAAAAA